MEPRCNDFSTHLWGRCVLNLLSLLCSCFSVYRHSSQRAVRLHNIDGKSEKVRENERDSRISSVYLSVARGYLLLLAYQTTQLNTSYTNTRAALRCVCMHNHARMACDIEYINETKRNAKKANVYCALLCQPAKQLQALPKPFTRTQPIHVSTISCCSRWDTNMGIWGKRR